MNTCRTCGLPTLRRLCHFCSRTVALVKTDRCVACAGPLSRRDDQRVEGKCVECRSRCVALSAGTREILRLAARARYQGGLRCA